ncbi:IS66 family insertion sequence element accessory protein TnpB [Pseudoalteromonas aliena]|uniref:IS66 family insertion sequence element accessory protein TnpB n=1 Tax=Pseudoalteromonas aliena TaxID=247523 RepID=UPI003CD0DDE8
MTKHVDFQKTISGLLVLIEGVLKRDAYIRALFLFCNKAKDKLKLLYWDKTGFKRIENVVVNKIWLQF